MQAKCLHWLDSFGERKKILDKYREKRYNKCERQLQVLYLIVIVRFKMPLGRLLLILLMMKLKAKLLLACITQFALSLGDE